MTPPSKSAGKKPPKAKQGKKGPIVVTFARERETPGTQRFEEEAARDDRRVGYIYLKKSTDKSLGSPERLQATLEAAP